jgi:hypothetical protein
VGDLHFNSLDLIKLVFYFHPSDIKGLWRDGVRLKLCFFDVTNNSGKSKKNLDRFIRFINIAYKKTR